MGMFIVRVELPDADYSDYQKLYDLMSGYGFTKYIISNSGIKYDLPDAEYYYNGSSGMDLVSDTAFRVAKSVRIHAKILVTEAKLVKWKGLNQH
ncbi:hypothetical protein AB7W76_20720 [Providencia rettgeri]